MKNSHLILYVILFLAPLLNAAAQNIISNEETSFCDSLKSAVEPLLCPIPLDKMPEFVQPFDEVLNNFIEKIDRTYFDTTIYVRSYIDTSGIPRCSEIFRHGNAKNDSIALDYINGLKFTPALFHGEKYAMTVMIPLLGNNTRETKDLIKIKGKWHLKSELEN